MTSSISFIFWVIKTLSFKSFNSKLSPVNPPPPKKKHESLKDDEMHTSGGHLYVQHGLSLDSEEPGIIQKKQKKRKKTNGLLLFKKTLQNSLVDKH
jgi:hypothetical protein